MAEYKFLKEVNDFDLDNYISLIGWIGDKPQKIYASNDYQCFFLYDEISDRFFEFEADLASVRGGNSGEREPAFRGT